MTDWMDRAACRGHDPELWFSNDATDRDLARAVCDRCPVRRDCGQHADSINAEGIWGGRWRVHSGSSTGRIVTSDYVPQLPEAVYVERFAALVTAYADDGPDPLDRAAALAGISRSAMQMTAKWAQRRGWWTPGIYGCGRGRSTKGQPTPAGRRAVALVMEGATA